MSKKYSGGIIKGETPVTPTATSASGIWTLDQAQSFSKAGIWPRIPGAPTCVSATAGTYKNASVSFVAPSDIGSTAITGYTAVATPGCIAVSGASSPISFTGLTGGTSYTFNVVATNSVGNGPAKLSNSISAASGGCATYTTAGTYTWIAPAGVTSVSALTVGGGGGTKLSSCGSFGNGMTGGGGGGALRYKNNITVVPGNSYTIVVGAGGTGGWSGGGTGGTSYFINSSTVSAYGGTGTTSTCGGAGGTSGVGTGGNGGNGGAYRMGGWGGPSGGGGGGGGAAGYSGNGGAGGAGGCSGSAGAGGGGGGGVGGIRNTTTAYKGQGGPGGGVGIYGQGASGNGGTASNTFAYISGYGGSGGEGTGSQTGLGQKYGGGGSSGFNGTNYTCMGQGGVGAVRIVWPGCARTFPTTNVSA